MRRLSIALVIAAVAGCGGGEDENISGKVEEKLRDEVGESGGKSQLKGIACPDKVEPKKGKKFECALTARDGTKAILEVTLKDDKGTPTVTNVRPASP